LLLLLLLLLLLCSCSRSESKDTTGEAASCRDGLPAAANLLALGFLMHCGISGGLSKLQVIGQPVGGVRRPMTA
jgi:hypothetical protein